MRSARRAAVVLAGLVSAGAAAATAAAPGGETQGAFRPLQQRGEAAVSSNWAGYVVQAPTGATTPVTFTDVVGIWVQPKLSCTKGRSASSGFWVGLGGSIASSEALEQIGTAADCTGAGKAAYYAWYELVPAPPVRLKLKVAPGDRLLGAVAYVDGRVVLELKNGTRHVTFTRTAAVPAPDLSSAEWIAEAPSICSSGTSCSIVRLANFRRVLFTQAAVTGADHTGTITDPAWEATPFTLAPDTSALDPFSPTPIGTAGAIPSPLATDGRSFSVTWSPSVTAR